MAFLSTAPERVSPSLRTSGFRTDFQIVSTGKMKKIFKSMKIVNILLIF